MRVFFAGDTGCGPHFQAIGRSYGSIDVALRPIGACAPKWFMGPQHMDPSQAVQAFMDVGARRALGAHYKLFQLANEGQDTPKLALEAALARHAVPKTHFCAPNMGRSIRFAAQLAHFAPDGRQQTQPPTQTAAQ